MINLKTTPEFEESIYQALPSKLKEATDLYEDKREKDVFLISAISILSACMPGITGRYDKSTVTPNIYVFVIAPPGSGKSAVNHARSLGLGIHNMCMKKERTGNFKPTFFIPGNTSPSALIEHLNSNSHSNGVLCETEADTLGQVMMQDWGNYSEILRKAFHHETISISRKREYEFAEIKSPRLSLLISGTPDQLKPIVASVKNGLFSRFAFYCYSVPLEWKDVTPDNSGSIDSLLEPLKETFSSIYDKFSCMEFQYTLSKEQWNRLNDEFRPLLKELTEPLGEDIASVIKRYGLIAFRISMILSGLRQHETIETDRIICSEDDFDTAMKLTHSLIGHSVTAYKMHSKMEDIRVLYGKELFFSKLPSFEFTRAQAVETGSVNKIQESTVDKYLRLLLEEGKLTKPNYGTYKKMIQTVEGAQTDESQPDT